MKYLLTIALLLCILVSCEKPPAEKPITTGTVTFWSTERNDWILYVDGQERGTVNQPYHIGSTDKIPVCGDTRFTQLHLSPGRHSFYLYLFIPAQPGQNAFTGKTYYFDVTLGGCTIVRAEQ